MEYLVSKAKTKDLNAQMVRILTLDLRLPILVAIVYGKVGASHLLTHPQLVIRTRCSNHFGAHRFGNLNRADPHASCSRMHQHPLVRLNVGPKLQRSITRRPRDKQSSSLFECNTFGNLHELPVVCFCLLAVRSLSSTKDARFAGDKIAPVGDGGVLGDDSGHFDTGNIRMRRLDLVFALNSEDVEKVERGRMDVDENLVGAGRGFGLGYIVGERRGKLGWRDIFVQVEGPHFSNSQRCVEMMEEVRKRLTVFVCREERQSQLRTHGPTAHAGSRANRFSGFFFLRAASEC